MVLSENFNLVKITLGSVAKYKGLIDGVKVEDSFDSEIIDSELSGRFSKIAQAIEAKVTTKIPVFGSVEGRLELRSVEINTIGKGENKQTVYIFQCTNLQGPNKNKIISGELLEEGLPKGLLGDIKKLNEVLSDILKRDRSQEEDAIQQQLEEAEEYDEEFELAAR